MRQKKCICPKILEVHMSKVSIFRNFSRKNDIFKEFSIFGTTFHIRKFRTFGHIDFFITIFSQKKNIYVILHGNSPKKILCGQKIFM